MLITFKSFTEHHIFIGPSMPLTDLHANARVHPPVTKGDLDCLTLSKPAVITIIDGLFWHAPAIPHSEIIHSLRLGHAIVGAASMGALRAVELRQLGMIGVGTIFDFYMNGRLTDDSELAQAVCPLSSKGLTIPLVRFRRALAMAQISHSELKTSYLTQALSLAKDIYFLERTVEALGDRLRKGIGNERTAILMSLVTDPASDIKAEDAQHAVDFGTQLASTGRTIIAPQTSPLF